ncbi:protein FAR1-RELATED SEQUENCE 5-like [Vicia villosa]|uniref:protein FAR1-RELATED SEQUENCE 5-like n=1 Tax=Vicia villosa TaxID=3911 RepID=UPI00273AFC02|nr:protein FAR1-RELATED SEQUENCE 5-like [Vicia villosa]
MAHPDNISRELVPLVDVSLNVEGVVVKAVDVGGGFNNKKEFDDRESMLTWIRRIAINLGFSVVIGRSNNGTTRRNAFVTMLCEKSEKYHSPLMKFKRDETGSRKYECPFKICCYMLTSKKWRFSVIYDLHNHDLCSKLQGRPSVCRLKPEEKTCISDMSLNLVQPKNILVTLKRKEPDIWYHNNKVIKGDRSEMQQLLKLLDDNKYVSRYRTCDDGVTVRDIFWTRPDSIKLFNTFSTMLILDSTYRTNKYRLPLFEMVGVTSIEKTYAVCQSLLKEQVEMPEAIVTDRDTTLMNEVAKMKLDEPIRMNEVSPHWKRLSFDDDGCIEGEN